MNVQTTRYLFAALCAVFFFIIAGAAAWEWNRFARGQSALSPRHLRWRLLSAFVWLLVLGSFAYTCAFLWPQSSQNKGEVYRAAVVMAGATLLMLVGFGLMTFDILWTVQIGRRGAVKRAQTSHDTLQRELERAQQSARNEQGGSDSNGAS